MGDLLSRLSSTALGIPALAHAGVALPLRSALDHSSEAARMTVYGWDCSNHDWDPDRCPVGQVPMNLVRAKSEGIQLFTHKAAEGAPGWYDDPYFIAAMGRAKSAGIPVIGGYYAMHHGDNQQLCADHFVDLVNEAAPWWRDACYIWQLDAEPFGSFSAPTRTEIEAFAYRLENQHGIERCKILLYAPEWVYGDGLAGLPWRLWQSSYVNSGGESPAYLYPGDYSTRWDAYSGQTPLILQFTSAAVIAGQAPCDANALRVSTTADLVALFTEGLSIMDAETKAYLDAKFSEVAKGFGLMLYGDSREAAEGKKPQGHPFNLFQIYGRQDDLDKDVSDLQADVANLPTASNIANAVIAALPPSVTGSLTDIDLNEIKEVVATVLSGTKLSPQPPTT